VIARHLPGSAHRQKAWRWENWGVTPDVPTQLALAKELGIPEDQVHRQGWPGWLPAGPGIDMQVAWDFDGSVRLLDNAAGGAVTDRRGFLLLGAGAVGSLTHNWLTVEPSRIGHVLKGGRIDARLIDCLEQRLPGLRTMDMTLGGGSIRGMVDAELRLVTNLLREGSFTEAVGARLVAVAAELARIAGWASFDAGYHAAAERYWVAALRAAHSSGSAVQGANILKCMSLQRVDTERPAEALELASAARAGAQKAHARVRAMLATREARTHAVLGDAGACDRLLAAAETAMGRADDERTPDWAAYFDKAEYCAQVAACNLLLHRHRVADEWLAQTLALQPASRRRDRATYLIWRADAAHHLGDLDQAVELVRRAVPDIADARSARNTRRLGDITKQLAQHKTAATIALTDQVRDMRAA